MVVIESMSGSECLGNVKYMYYYRMIKSNLKLDLDNEKIEVQSYGIEIERQDIVDDKIVGIERDSVKNISPERHKVHNLLKLLYASKVSPIHLIDIVGSYVDEYISDFDMISRETAMV
jgi:hypothetical protein